MQAYLNVSNECDQSRMRDIISALRRKKYKLSIDLHHTNHKRITRVYVYDIDEDKVDSLCNYWLNKFFGVSVSIPINRS